MKLIIDCNVIISAALTDGICRQVVFKALKKHKIIVTDCILSEYKAVAMRKKFLSVQYVLLEIIEIIEALAAKIEDSVVEGIIIPDPKDLIYVYAGINAQANYLITGNIKDFPELVYKSVEVILPNSFLLLTMQTELAFL